VAEVSAADSGAIVIKAKTANESAVNVGRGLQHIVFPILVDGNSHDRKIDGLRCWGSVRRRVFTAAKKSHDGAPPQGGRRASRIS
jgi:hypothetical protein